MIASLPIAYSNSGKDALFKGINVSDRLSFVRVLAWQTHFVLLLHIMKTSGTMAFVCCRDDELNILAQVQLSGTY